ncbi:MAG: hypothetical protein WBY53_20480 [Acidobacteriaceae bacterium]
MSKLEMQLANPLLIFIYSLSIFLFGCAIGIHWHSSTGTAVGLAFAGAALMVLHDTISSLIWFGIAAMWVRRAIAEARK